MNTFGERFQITIYGEAHGSAVGVVIEGVPAGTELHEDRIQERLNRRRPGSSRIVSQRKEKDHARNQSGVFEGKATGSPISFWIPTTDARTKHYEERKHTPRPGHADFTAYLKYGEARDWRGGAHFSGRLTAPIVLAGAVAEHLLEKEQIQCVAHTKRVGSVEAPEVDPNELEPGDLHPPVLCADEETAVEMEETIDSVRKDRDSLGGLIETVVTGVPGGMGEVFFGRADAKLSHLCMAIPAVKGIEFGAGFDVAKRKGSENNDPFAIEDGKIVTETNHAGGLLGGLTTGMPVVFRVPVKPTSSIPREQKTVDLKEREETTIRVKGRHDPCIVPRAVPVLRACAQVVTADLLLLSETTGRAD